MTLWNIPDQHALWFLHYARQFLLRGLHRGVPGRDVNLPSLTPASVSGNARTFSLSAAEAGRLGLGTSEMGLYQFRLPPILEWLARSLDRTMCSLHGTKTGDMWSIWRLCERPLSLRRLVPQPLHHEDME